MKHVSRRTALQVGLCGLALACGKKSPSDGPSPAAGAVVTLTGSGASFPAPLYSRWFQDYGKRDPLVRVNYQATGSGAGIRAFIDGQTDFGASDAAMTDDELKQAGFEVLMLPLVAGSVVLAYNLEGASGVKFSRETYVGIFTGEISNWNDAKIKADNPSLTLPDQKITVVHRSDGSGTTFVFTSHLAAISPKWKTAPGVGTSIEWPVGVGGRKNDGVAALIKQTPGAIGYVEYGYAAATSLPMATLQNQRGQFVVPTIESAAAALAASTMPADLRAWVNDPGAEGAYPIVTYTWLLARKQYADKSKGQALKKVLDHCLGEGQQIAQSLHYVPLPLAVLAQVKQAAGTLQ
jgi:phosphate transport system substrate-binding protein